MVTTAPRRRRLWRRVTESQVSIALSVAVLIFFIDGFLRGASLFAGIVLIPLGLLVIAGLIAIADSAPIRSIHFTSIALTLTGTLLVGFGVRVLNLSSSFSAACVGVLAGFLPLVIRRLNPADALPLYVGAFAGMTSPVVLLGTGWLVLAGLVTGLLWSVARDAWDGIGGKAGTIAFAGVGITTLLAFVTGASDGAAPLTPYAPLAQIAILGVSLASALATHAIAYRLRLGAVLGSALPLLVVVVLTLGISQAVEFPNDALIAAWFGAGFVGMTAPHRLRGWWMLPAMALTFGVLLIAFTAHLSGLGGDLGATASAAVIAVIGARAISDRVLRHG